MDSSPGRRYHQRTSSGVCGILVSKTQSGGDPWDHIDISIQPPDYGVGLPLDSPYGTTPEIRYINQLYTQPNKVGTQADASIWITSLFSNLR